MSKKIVLALGGNALGDDLAGQMKAVKITSQAIVDLIAQGHEVVQRKLTDLRCNTSIRSA